MTTGAGRSRGRPGSPDPRAGPAPAGGPVRPTGGQANRRRAAPGFHLTVGLLWLAAGVVELVGVHAAWRVAPAIVFVGIGLLFVRGAGALVLARPRRP